MLPKNKQRLNDYARFSSLGFQMLAVILLSVLGGLKLDRWLELRFPVFTVVGSLAGVAMSIYFAVKDLLRKK